MAGKQGSKDGKTTKRSRLKYFFLHGQIHKTLKINNGRDLLIAWNYPEIKKVTYSYSATLKSYEPAFTTKQVMEMLNRRRTTLEVAMKTGMIEYPQRTYGLDENMNFRQYMWREKDIMDAHAYFVTIHRGRPRNDGMIVSQDLPSQRELRALIHDEEIMYVKQGDTFVPSWRAKEFT